MLLVRSVQQKHSCIVVAVCCVALVFFVVVLRERGAFGFFLVGAFCLGLGGGVFAIGGAITSSSTLTTVSWGGGVSFGGGGATTSFTTASVFFSKMSSLPLSFLPNFLVVVLHHFHQTIDHQRKLN